MLRALVALLAVTSVSGQDTAACALDSARAVDDIMDGVVYIFASIVRCDPNTGDKVRCTLDVSAAIESVNKMVNIIVKAVDQCGEITTANPECGIGIGELTRSLAGLTSASAGIVAKCPNAANGGHPMTTVNDVMAAGAQAAAGANTAANTAKAAASGFSNSFGQCTLNVKDSVKSLFKAVKRAMVMGNGCAPGSAECAHNAIKLVDAFVGLAEYISGSVSNCASNVNDKVNAGCAQMSARLTHATGEVGVAATRLAAACQPTPAARLYLDSLDNKKAAAAPATNSLTMGLTALLPLTAVIAFAAGKRLAKTRMQQIPDEELVVE